MKIGRVIAAGAVGLALAGCTARGTSSPTTTTTTTIVSPSTTATPLASAASSSTTAPGHFIPAATPVYEFYSPSHNISCEIDYATSGTPTDSVLCTTMSPTQSVVMSADGSLRTCYGEQCGSNAGLNTPTLAYGDSTGVGPFRCTSTLAAMICTVTSGKGFNISRTGITTING
jgi:hypothetical protein